jgi:SAM-dependent methyltransferase
MPLDAVDFSFWNTVDLTKFLAKDRRQPSRALCAEIFSMAMPPAPMKATLIEVGCGTGFDYLDHFRHIDRLDYLGLDGSQAMVEHCKKEACADCFVLGTFETLQECKRGAFDFSYVKAVLEHQPDFEPALRALLRVTKMFSILNWYLAPGETEELGYRDDLPMHYNRYSAAAVQSVVQDCGFSVLQVPAGPNELWLLKPIDKT